MRTKFLECPLITGFAIQYIKSITYRHRNKWPHITCLNHTNTVEFPWATIPLGQPFPWGDHSPGATIPILRPLFHSPDFSSMPSTVKLFSTFFLYCDHSSITTTWSQSLRWSLKRNFTVHSHHSFYCTKNYIIMCYLKRWTEVRRSRGQ